MQPEWLERYGHRAEAYRLPNGEEKRQALLHQVGQDGWGLLAAIHAEPTIDWMLSIPAIDTLQRVWKQDYLPPEKGGTWIPDEDRLPAAKLFYSPYDLDAAAGSKRATHWIGYKVHFSETCDEELPRLITQVTTTIAPTPDRHALPETHAILEQRELLPEQHLVDTGYIDAESLVASQATSCPVRSQCTKAKRRSLSVRRQEAQFALAVARQREQTEEFKKEYAKRAGIEGVHAKAGAYDGLAPLALHWGTSDSSSTCRDRDCHECVPIA